MMPRPSFTNKRRSTSRLRVGTVFDAEIASQSDGMTVLKVKGAKAFKVFRNEAGGHRWQRIPPNDRSGRVHSSTVTVAVLGTERETNVEIRPQDLEITFCRGSGPGGQHRQKTDSAVQIKHIPTGLIVCNESERSQHENKRAAMETLQSRLNQAASTVEDRKRGDKRREQIGSGERSDKIRTVQVKNDVVMDHRTGRKMPVDKYLKGNLFD